MADFNLKMQEYHDGTARGLRLYMYRYWMSYQNKRFSESYWPAFKRSKNKKRVFNILNDIIRLTVYWRCLPYHYFRYGLYDKKKSSKKLLDYLPETVFYYKILPKINKQMFILDDKNLFEEFIRGQDVKYPRTVLKISKGIIFDENTNIVDADTQLDTVLEKVKVESLFCKPSNWGSGGKGIFSIVRSNTRFYDSLGNEFDIKYLKKLSLTDWIIQEAVQNRADLGRIYRYSVNSFRILTFFTPDHGARAVYCILKFGNKKAVTDNAHTGGIYVRVNMDSGLLDDTAYDEDLFEHKVHPFNGYEFAGTRINDIKEILKTAELLGNKLPNLTFIGWDIALTPEGPVVLEGNSSPGLTIIQRTYDGMKEFINLVEKPEKAL